MASLPELVGSLLSERHLTLATAESCTGGRLGDQITSVPGSSEYYIGGVVAYAYAAKTELLGITQEFLLAHGAVSSETAVAMAQGVRRRLKTDLGIAITGILGPGGGMPNKPVGLVYIGLAAADREFARRFQWNGGRLANKESSVNAALEIILDYLAEQNL
jgi:nicotinamide-nucleotide amidase